MSIEDLRKYLENANSRQILSLSSIAIKIGLLKSRQHSQEDDGLDHQSSSLEDDKDRS